MAALLTQRPGAYLNVSVDPATGKVTKSGQRVFDVTGAANSGEAYAALAAAGFDFGQPYDTSNTDAIVSGNNSSFSPVSGMYTYTLTFGTKNLTGGGSTNVLSMRYEPYSYTEYSDYSDDSPQAPFTNTVGTPFDPPLEKEYVGCIITIKVPRDTYPASDLFTYGGTVNSADLLLPDSNVVPTGKAKCLGIFGPETYIDATSGPQATEVKLDVRPTGWDRNIANIGAEGWAKDANGKYFKGLITTAATGSGPAGPVRLKADGTPIETIYTKVINPVSRTAYDLVAPQTPTLSQSLVNADLGSDQLVVISFRRNLRTDLNALF